MTERKIDFAMARSAHARPSGAGLDRLQCRRPLRALALAAALGAFSSAALAADPAQAPDSQRAQIEAIVHDYILDHPEILPQAIDILHKRETTKAVNDHRAQIETPYSTAWEGAKNGDVVLTVFFDYACPHCRASLPDVYRLLSEDKKLKVVYRDLPILGDDSVAAARVDLLAANEGHYSVYHKAMFDGDAVDEAAILSAATKAGLDPAKVKAALASQNGSDEFAKNDDLARSLNANGTPLFVVGDQVLVGDVGYDTLKSAVIAARGKKAA